MAETPPSGSLLSSFISGGDLGGRPQGFTPKKRKDYIPPGNLPPDQSALVGGLVAGAGIGAASEFFRGFKEELVGTGTLRRFGGEDQVVTAAYDYAQKASAREDPGLLKELDIDTEAKFAEKYRAFMQAKQVEDNEKRRAAGKPEIKGFGNYEVKLTGVSAAAGAPASVASQVAARQLELQLKRVDQLSVDHPELSLFTKQEIADYLPEFLKKTIQDKSAELAKSLASSSGIGVRNLYNKLQVMLAQYEDDQHKPEEARTSTIHKIQKAVRDKVFSKALLRQMPKIVSDLYKFSTNPFGSIWKNYIVGESRIFGRQGLGLGRRLAEWLGRQGIWGQGLKWLGTNWRLGVGGLVRKGIFNAGKLTGRLTASAGRMVASAVARLAVAAVSYLGGAMAAIAGTIVASFGLILVVVFLVTVIVIIVLIPLGMQNAQAAPPDFAITAQANPSSDVGPDTAVQISIQLSANRDAQDVSVKAAFDGNFAAGSIGNISPDGDISGMTVTMPKTVYPVITKGQTLSFQLSARTASDMSTTKVAVVTISAIVKNTVSAQTTIALNGSGVFQYDTNYPYGWPTAGNITQGLHPDIYGCSNIFTCGTAVDIGGAGHKIYATMDGIVQRIDDGCTLLDSPNCPGVGPWIENETSGYWTIFNHMDASALAVKPGDHVRRCQYLGLSDNSGITNGPHLHYAIYTQQGRKGSPGYDFYRYVPAGNLDSTGALLSTTISDTGIGCQ